MSISVLGMPLPISNYQTRIELTSPFSKTLTLAAIPRISEHSAKGSRTLRTRITVSNVVTLQIGEELLRYPQIERMG
jgi:hypothetical protein